MLLYEHDRTKDRKSVGYIFTGDLHSDYPFSTQEKVKAKNCDPVSFYRATAK